MNRIPRRLFTAELTREAIKSVAEKNLTLAEAGRKLDAATPRASINVQVQAYQLGQYESLACSFEKSRY